MFIAKTAGANSLSVSNNKNTQHTPLYTAPEYLRDPSLPKTPEMDVYGYAMCAYEILTRKRVFSDASLHYEIVKNMIKEDGLKPTLKIVDEVANENKKSLKNLEMLSTFKKVMIMSWATNCEERPDISTIWQIFNHLRKSQNIYDVEVTKEAKHLALKISRTLDEEIERVPIDQWNNPYSLNIEEPLHDCPPVSVKPMSHHVGQNEQLRAESERKPLLENPESSLSRHAEASRRATVVNSNECASLKCCLNKCKTKKKTCIFGMSFSMWIAVVVALPIYIKGQILVVDSPNFADYAVERGGEVQILCSAKTVLSTYPVTWSKVTNSSIPKVSPQDSGIGLPEYQVVYSDTNDALLVLKNVRQSASYLCLAGSTNVKQITIKVKTASQPILSDAKLNCLDGRAKSG